MKILAVFLVLCAIATAMVVREKRGETATETAATSTSTPKPTYCGSQTPCAWSTYKPVFKIIEVNITNTYCKCSPDSTCQVTEDDSNANAYVYRCRPPNFASEDILDS